MLDVRAANVPVMLSIWKAERSWVKEYLSSPLAVVGSSASVALTSTTFVPERIKIISLLNASGLSALQKIPTQNAPVLNIMSAWLINSSWLRVKIVLFKSAMCLFALKEVLMNLTGVDIMFHFSQTFHSLVYFYSKLSLDGKCQIHTWSTRKVFLQEFAL